MAGTINVGDDNFNKEVLEADKVVLVDFWAPWCGPCRIIGPIIEEIAQEKTGVIKVAKLNVDDNPVTASKYSVMSIPTVIIFKEGEVNSTITGAVPKENLESLIEKALNG